MTGCSNTCASTTPIHGDNVILKGGVTWPNASLGWSVSYSGNASTSTYGCTGTGCIYIGVDQTWFTGGSWTRPILNGQGADVAGNNTFLLLTCSYCIVDNIEFTGFFYDTNLGYGQDSYINFAVPTNGELKNSYFHGWAHKTPTSGLTDSGAVVIGSTQACPPDGAGGNQFSSWHDNVVDGSDTTKDMMDFSHGGPALVYNNFTQWVTNGTVGYNKWVYQNTLINYPQSFDGTKHENGIESTNCQGIYFNNLLGNIAGSPIFHSPVDNSIDYDFNNVLYDSAVQEIQIDNNSLTTGTGSGIYVFNDTIQVPSSVSFAAIAGPSRAGFPNLPFINAFNNHLIGVCQATSCISFGLTTTQTQNHNIQQLNATATSQGYTDLQTYPFFPTTGGSTIGAGTSSVTTCGLVPLPPGLTSAVCTNDTTAGVGENVTNHTVIVPNRSAVARGGTPDTGAYQFAGGGGSGNTQFSGRYTVSGQMTETTNGSSGVAITSSATLPGCTVGVLCSDTLTATGGVGSYVWSLFSGAFPSNSNFTLSAGGVLSGVPSAASTCSGCMTIQVCDSTLVNCATQAFSITISAGSLAFVNNALPDGTQSAAYSATALVTGGTLPYTSCSVFSGSLPTGLGVAVTGSGLLAGCLISGTVGGSAVGTTFILSVTDTASTTVHSATLSISITVAGACGFPFFPCGNISTTIHPLAQAANANPSCFDSPGAANCKQPVPQLGFAGVLGQLTITTPGTCSVHPTLGFSGGTFTRAGAATAVWSSTNSLVGLTYSDYGAYTVAPSVAFSGGTCSTAPVATVALQSVSCNGHQCQGGLFGANSVVNGYSGAIVSNDPFYGSGRVLRLTDALVDPSNPYRSCFTDSSAENAQTNYDGTIIKASCGLWSDLLSLDYSIWNSGACAIGSTTCNAFKLQLVGKGGAFPGSFIFGQTNATPASPADATSDKYAFYAFDNCNAGGFSTCAKVERWLICGPTGNTSTLCPGGWAAVVDPNWPTTGSGGYDVTQASCAGSTYMTGSVVGQGLFTPWASFGNSAMNASDNRFTAELRIFNGFQDEGGTSVTVDTSVAGSPRCKVLDISRGLVSTDWNNSTPVAITSAVCSGSSCTQVFNPLLPPAMPVLSSGGVGTLNATHTYAVALSYSLRNSRGSQKSPGDQGETNGSSISTISGVTKIAIAPPGNPGDAAPGVAPVNGQNIPNSNCILGTKSNRCVIPTGYNIFICDRTSTPGCTPVRAQVDQAPGGYTSIALTSETRSGTLVTVNVPSTLALGSPGGTGTITIGGTSNDVVFAGTWTYTITNSSQFTYNTISSGTATGSGGNGAINFGPSASTLTCTPASGNTGSTYTYIYSVTVRHSNGTILDFGSPNITAACTTASPITTAKPNTLSWTAPTISASLLYDIDRGSTSSTVMENLIGRIACPASPCTLSDTSIGNVSGEEEMVSGTTTAVTISALPLAGSSAAYSGLQGTGGASTHNIKMDMSGNPIIPVPTAIANNLGFPVADWQWYADATASCNSVFQNCPYDPHKVYYCPILCTGHRVSGNGGQIRNPANTSNIQFILAAPMESQNIISMVNDSMCSGNKCQGAQHDNWSLGVNSFANYPMATTYSAGTNYGSPSWPKQLYTGEAIFLPSGDSRASSAVTSISQTANTVTATLANSVGCINNVFTLCFAPGMQINTTSIPTGVSHATNWNGQHTLATVNVGSNQVTWTSGASVSDTAGSGGSLNGCGGGAALTGGALSNPNCFAIREGMLYSNGNEATRFYGTPRGFISQVGASSPLIYASSAYTYWNEASTHFNQAPTSLARVSGTVTATFASTATLSSSAKTVSVTGKATGTNASSFNGEFPIASTTGTTITWLQPGVDDTVTPTAGTCNGAGTATCVDASDSYCFGSSLGDEFGAPDINMNSPTLAGCRVDIIVIEPR